MVNGNLLCVTVNGFSMIHQFKWDLSDNIKKVARVPIFPRQPRPNSKDVGIIQIGEKLNRAAIDEFRLCSLYCNVERIPMVQNRDRQSCYKPVWQGSWLIKRWLTLSSKVQPASINTTRIWIKNFKLLWESYCLKNAN